MHVTTELNAEDVAREMSTEGEWAMDVFATLAVGQVRDRAKAVKEIANGNTLSGWHKDVPAFLRELADAIENVK